MNEIPGQITIFDYMNLQKQSECYLYPCNGCIFLNSHMGCRHNNVKVEYIRTHMSEEIKQSKPPVMCGMDYDEPICPICGNLVATLEPVEIGKCYNCGQIIDYGAGKR